MPSAVRRSATAPEQRGRVEFDPEPPSDTEEWVAQPHPRREPRLLVEERPRPEPASSGDTGEQIRIAATGAAQQAEIRAMDEIVALERDIEEAREAAAAEVEELEASLRDAEERARAAEDEAAALASEREQFEDRAPRGGEAVAARADSRARGRGAEEDPSRGRAPQGRGRRGRRRRRDRRDGQRIRDAAARSPGLVEAETEELPSLPREGSRRAEAGSTRPGGRSGTEPPTSSSAACTRRPPTAEERQRELAAARAEAESSAVERISKIEAEADERVRSEVAIARRAAEERFAESSERGRKSWTGARREDRADRGVRSKAQPDRAPGRARRRRGCRRRAAPGRRVGAASSRDRRAPERRGRRADRGGGGAGEAG